MHTACIFIDDKQINLICEIVYGDVRPAALIHHLRHHPSAFPRGALYILAQAQFLNPIEVGACGCHGPPKPRSLGF